MFSATLTQTWSVERLVVAAWWLDKPLLCLFAVLPRHPWPSSHSSPSWGPSSLLVWRFSSCCCTGACLQFVHWQKKDLILFLNVSRPWALRCFLGSLGWYQISPVRRLLYQPCCPPAKQMTAALHTHRHLALCDKWHVSPSPIHLSSISYYCQEKIATRMPLQREAAANTGHPGGCLSSILAARCCYF